MRVVVRVRIARGGPLVLKDQALVVEFDSGVGIVGGEVV
jgi:hypothetical protein